MTLAFKLDDQPSPKPVLGVDDLLLGLTHHWCRDRSVFPTEDDRLDLSTIMLFQSYTACRPAELVDSTKSRGRQDPLLDDSDDDASAGMYTTRIRTLQPTVKAQLIKKEEPEASEEEFSSGSSDLVCDDTSDTSDTEYDDEDTESSDGLKQLDNGLEMDRAHDFIHGTDEAEEDCQPVRKYKALCYEDIVLWIVQDPNAGGRDVLAMEVSFRHHKGANRKPKPYVDPEATQALPLTIVQYHIFVS